MKVEIQNKKKHNIIKRKDKHNLIYENKLTHIKYKVIFIKNTFLIPNSNF